MIDYYELKKNMENNTIKFHIIRSNFSTMKFVSLIALAFAIFLLTTDFVFQNIWTVEYLFLYKILDIIFIFITLIAIYFFWFSKSENIKLKNCCTIAFPFLILIWSAIITGIDIQVLGLSTFVIILLTCAFFLYLNYFLSILFCLSSSLVLLLTIYINNNLNQTILPIIFLIVPISLFSIFMSIRNYRNKITDLANQEKITQMNSHLLYANENLEKEVLVRTSEIRKALEKSEESDRLKTSFLRNMSHEIRTPLNAIIGFSNLLTSGNLPVEKQNFYASLISSSGQKLIDVINDVVEISQIHANQMKANFSKINLNMFIQEITKDFSEKAKNKNITFQLKIHLGKDFQLFTDREKLKKIVIHLFVNAFKFTEKGSIIFTCELDCDNVRISISDTGIGISDDMQKVIFEPFRQVELNLNRNFGGNGLGLPIAKAYVELMNGSISLKSEIGVGSMFTILLPVINRNEIVVCPKIENRKIICKTILIAEDEDANYQYLLAIIDKSKYTILFAENGHIALQMCQENFEIGLVLMDIKMPIMDGFTAAKLIKEFRPNLPVIAQTAFALDTDIDRFKDVFDDYITKPINKDILNEKLNKFIENINT